jgi:RNA polymerase sigma-70 factor, ECF subfamily
MSNGRQSMNPEEHAAAGSAPQVHTRGIQKPSEPAPAHSASNGDAGLVRRAKAGELAAFEELVHRHERAVYSLARRMLQNEHDAEDITQQTFVSALEHLEGFREEARLSTWLLRIATYAALKVVRKRRGLDMMSLEAATEPQDDGKIAYPKCIADWSITSDTLAGQKETLELIEEALDELDEKHRFVLILRDVEGFSGKETAEALGISEANVKVRLLRARLQLRERLTRRLGDPARQIQRKPHTH